MYTDLYQVHIVTEKKHQVRPPGSKLQICFGTEEQMEENKLSALTNELRPDKIPFQGYGAQRSSKSFIGAHVQNRP